MPRTVVLEDGTEIELPDNIFDELKEEGVQEFKEANPDVDRIEELKIAAEEAAEKVAELEQKQKQNTAEQNLSELRRQKEAAEREAKEATERLEKEIVGVKNLVANKAKGDTLNRLVGDDEDLKKAVLHIYDTALAAMPSSTDEEIAERVKTAYKIVKPESAPSKMGFEAVSSSGGTGVKVTKDDSVDQDFLKHAGITPDDVKKLKPKVQEMRERRYI